jgi:hypothetical protein
MTNHAPGPWSGEVHELSEGPSGIVYDANGYCVADGLKPSDVHIIAAGPSLLASLKELKELFRFALLSTTPELAKDGMEFIRKAEAVIAKAEGHTPT